MPFRVRITENRGLPPSSPMARGGYERTGIPDPNDPMEIYRRSHGNILSGTYGSSPMPTANAPNPLLTASGGGALGQNIALAQRGMEHRKQYEAGEQQRRTEAGNVGLSAFAPLSTVLPDPRWEGLKQALYEAGTDKLAADAGFGASQYNPQTQMTTMRRQPGFFGTQTPGQPQAYDPREAQVGGFAGSPTSQAMGRLQGQSGYDPQASQRALGVLKELYKGYGVAPRYDIFR